MKGLGFKNAPATWNQPSDYAMRNLRLDEAKRFVTEAACCSIRESKKARGDKEPPSLDFPRGASERKDSIATFKSTVEKGSFDGVARKLGLKMVGRKESLEFWRNVKSHFEWLNDEEMRILQRHVAAIRKKNKRHNDRARGISERGRLLPADKWRVIEMGDSHEDVWRKKLSFVPTVQLGTFGPQNLARLQRLQDQLVDAVRLHGGADVMKTKKHQSGISLGITVAPGGRQPNHPMQGKNRYSGTIQYKTMRTTKMSQLQTDALSVMTACIEEAFGSTHWYKATKECFKGIPPNRRLPGTTLPASSIWWSWNDHVSKVHIDWNTVAPCFVLTPYTYDGANLLVGEKDRKIPMKAGSVVGGNWQRFPHCNDELLSGDRYSFVVYFDCRVLQSNYWMRKESKY
jgi:hypothetical protein